MQLLSGLKTGEKYKFGKPWRLTDKHLSVVVPIIRVGSAGKRHYVLLEEVGDKAKPTDSGSIGSVKVKGGR